MFGIISFFCELKKEDEVCIFFCCRSDRVSIKHREHSYQWGKFRQELDLAEDISEQSALLAFSSTFGIDVTSELNVSSGLIRRRGLQDTRSYGKVKLLHRLYHSQQGKDFQTQKLKVTSFFFLCDLLSKLALRLPLRRRHEERLRLHG